MSNFVFRLLDFAWSGSGFPNLLGPPGQSTRTSSGIRHVIYPDGKHVYVSGDDDDAVVVVSPCGGFVYVAGYADHALAVFGRDRNTGILTYQGMKEDGVGGVDGLGGAFSVTASPDGKNVYVLGYDDHAVAVFGRYLICLPLVIKD